MMDSYGITAEQLKQDAFVSAVSHDPFEIKTMAEILNELMGAEIIPEDVVVIATQNGDIKRVPLKSFKVQKKNGKGVKSENDATLDVISTNTIDTLMIFTSKGKK